MNRRDFLRQSTVWTFGVTMAFRVRRPVVGAEQPDKARPAGTPATGPLSVHPDNPRYFTDSSGRAIYLTGSHLGWELQDDAWGREHTFDYPGFLDFLVEHNHNYLRLWMVEHTRWNSSNPKAVATPMPYRRTGPGKALDGGLKFDLTQFDPAYFERLRRRTVSAGKKGIYVAVMLFQGFSVHKLPARNQRHARNPWFGHPLNRRNNVNQIDGDANGDGDGRETYTLKNRSITKLQEAYVRKVVDTVNDLDNVLYEIGNECGGYATEWQYHMIRFIKNYEAGKPKQHPVGMTAQILGGDNNNEVLLKSPADWISPNRNGGYWDNPPAADGRKVIIADSDHIRANASREHRQWVWRCFLRGLNPIFMDWYPDEETKQLDKIVDARFDPQWERVRRSMGRTRSFARRLNLAACTPRNKLASTNYCLANPGREYLVYLPDGGNVTVDLSAASGPLLVEWFDPGTGKTKEAGATRGGARRNFTAPLAGDAVLYIHSIQE